MIKICFIHLQYNSKCTSFRSLAHNSGNDGPKQYNTQKKKVRILHSRLCSASKVVVCVLNSWNKRTIIGISYKTCDLKYTSIYLYLYLYIYRHYILWLTKKKKWTRAPVFLGFLFFFLSHSPSLAFFLFLLILSCFFAFVRWEGVDTHHSRGALSV